MTTSSRLFFAALPLAILLACGTATQNGVRTTTALRVPVPERVDDSNGPDLLRAFHSLSPDDPSRVALRDALLTWLAAGSEATIESGDAEALALHLAQLADLVHPSELERGEVPELFDAAARACLLSLEGRFKGHEAFYIVAPDTTLDTPSLEAAAKFFPGIPIKGDLSGRSAFFNSSKAERILGWKHDL